jgi:hypothetical protein
LSLVAHICLSLANVEKDRLGALPFRPVLAKGGVFLRQVCSSGVPHVPPRVGVPNEARLVGVTGANVGS